MTKEQIKALGPKKRKSRAMTPEKMELAYNALLHGLIDEARLRGLRLAGTGDLDKLRFQSTGPWPL